MLGPVKTRIVILGAGFGGLELSTLLSQARVGRVDIDFLSGPQPTGVFQEPSRELVAEKRHFGSSRRARWFAGQA
jgi:NADH dehydrogenase FAD-containing subunit